MLNSETHDGGIAMLLDRSGKIVQISLGGGDSGLRYREHFQHGPQAPKLSEVRRRKFHDEGAAMPIHRDDALLLELHESLPDRSAAHL